MVQNALLLLHGALVSNTFDIRGLIVLRLAIAFERALFPGLPVGRLTVFSLSVEAAM